MNAEADRARLSQEEMLKWLRRELKATDMLPVYRRGEEGSDGVYCVVVPRAQIGQVLSQPDWELTPEESAPSVDVMSEGGEERAESLRHGRKNGIQPLALARNFFGLRDGYMEVCEEFRLFHNLYHDSQQNQYIKFDAAGDETTVIVVEPNCIRIRLQEIRQFLASKDMYLSIQFGRVERATRSLNELGLKESARTHRDDLSCWRLVYGGEKRAWSRIRGKRLVEPLPKAKSGWRECADESGYVEFVIGIDQNGGEIAYSCNPAALANFFGANPEVPNYLTPVHFRKQVLDKYYQNPGKYSVGDSLVGCGALWALEIDNHHADKVCVWLGRLGDSLPFAEQRHWRTHNVAPEGGISEVYFQRQFQQRPMKTDQPDLLFKSRYHALRAASQTHLGWQILRPLHPDDGHHFQALRIPATDERRDFDSLVLSLATILIDSLHVKRLNSLLSEERKEGVNPGSIARLEAVLASRGVEGGAEHIAFLRSLQSLRSSSAAHRKGSEYENIAKRFNMERQSLRETCAGLLWQALGFLDFLLLLARSGRVENIEQNRSEEMYAILDELVGSVESDSTDGSVNHDALGDALRAKP